MSMNIFAYTAPDTNYPEFISVNTVGDEVEFIVRTAAWGDGTCGDTASIRLSMAQAYNLSRQLLEISSFVGVCTREVPHVCTMNGPCNGYPKTQEKK
jgi:hypothetical protein